jgi:hypothetical protein
VSVSANGFFPNETVDVTFDGAAIASTTASASGIIGTTFSVPGGKIAGTYVVEVRGQSSGALDVASFSLTGSATIALTSYEVVSGESDTVNCTHFAGGEAVRISIDATNLPQVTADANGSVSDPFTVPVLSLGWHDIECFGLTSHLAAITSFDAVALHISPHGGLGGTVIHAVGAGCAANDTVNLDFDLTHMATIAAGPTGLWSTDVAVPLGFLTANHSVLSTCTGNQVKGSANFNYFYQPTVTVFPSVLTKNEPFTVSGTGWAPNERVAIYWDGSYFNQAYADANGNLNPPPNGCCLVEPLVDIGAYVTVNLVGDVSQAQVSTRVFIE